MSWDQPSTWPDAVYIAAILGLGPGMVLLVLARQVLRDRARRRRGEDHDLGLERERAAQAERSSDLDARGGGAP